MLKKLFVLSLILVLGFSFSSKEKSKIQSENIIVLVIDGPRYTETWGDSTHAHIPNMYSQLLPQGVLYQDFRNTGFTITNGGHTAICTGVDQNIDNTGKEIRLGGNLTTQGELTTVSGSNTGDQTITLTGDVTGTGTGSFATTVNSVGGVSSSTITTINSTINWEVEQTLGSETATSTKSSGFK